MEDYKSEKSLGSFIESFTEKYLCMLSKFYPYNCGKAMRHKFNSIKSCIQEAGLTLIPNLDSSRFGDYQTFKNLVKQNIKDLSNEIFTFIQTSLKKDQKNFMIFSEDEGYKEISPRREDFLKAICNYFVVNILIYEGSSKPLQIDIDNADKICISLDYSKAGFKAHHHPNEDSATDTELLAMPYLFSIKASPKNIPLVESDAQKVLGNFLKLLIDAADTVKNYMTDSERDEIVEILKFDDAHSVKRNKFLNVKVCEHQGNFGVFSCHHYHCYSCLAEELKTGANYAELRCLCDNPISQADANTATSINIET